MKGKLPVKLPDIVIVLLFAGMTVFSGIYVYSRAQNATMVVIQGPGDRVWVYPLDSERTIRVRGILGDDTVVRISGGAAWAESSPCDNQTCVGMGRITAGSWWPALVACLPNNVFFRIDRAGDSGNIDGAAW